MATYPSNPNIPQGTNETAVNPTNWNMLVDNINAIGTDLVNSRGDGQTFPGTPHTPGQSNNINDMLNAIRHMIVTISGESNWYDDTAANLKVHDHSSNKGGAIPWRSIGTGNRSIELHPEYPGAVWTKSLRGAPPSGSNVVDRSTDQDVLSYVARNYYEADSSEALLQDYYIALRFTLPEDFGSWSSSNAIQIEYKTESLIINDNHVDAIIYKSGNADIVASIENNTSITWSTIVIDDSALGYWLPGDIMELYLKLETRNNCYARVGRIKLNYAS